MNSNLKKLKELRQRSNHHQHKMSAIILVKNKPISFGFNDKFKTTPKINNTLKTVHAEMSAIFKVKNKELLKGATIVVYRESKNGQMAIAKPCEVCNALIKGYGIKTIIYSTVMGWVEEKV